MLLYPRCVVVIATGVQTRSLLHTLTECDQDWASTILKLRYDTDAMTGYSFPTLHLSDQMQGFLKSRQVTMELQYITVNTAR